MKRCPNCQRTYTDDRMTNCAHDGAPLMFAAYSPQGAQPPQTPQGYPPPPAPGYPPPGYPPQSYPPPPPGYPPQNYPPQPGWQAGMSEYVPCPRCARPDPEKIKFTWWGGLVGPKMLKHVKCRSCAMTYNGKTGQSNTTNIIIYSIVLGVISFGLFFLLFFGLR
jgi:transposase-like protein